MRELYRLIGILCQCVQMHPERQSEAAEIERQIRLITLSPLSVWVSADKEDSAKKDKHRLQWKGLPAHSDPLGIDTLWPLGDSVLLCSHRRASMPSLQTCGNLITVQATNKYKYIRHMEVFTVLSPLCFCLLSKHFLFLLIIFFL